jgi:hypothetical protein
VAADLQVCQAVYYSLDAVILRLLLRTIIALGALGVGGWSAWVGLGALIGLSEPGPPALVRLAQVAALVTIGAVLWALFMLITLLWRTTLRDLGSVAVAIVGQFCLWRLGQDGAVQAWTAQPSILAFVALASVPLAWGLVLEWKWRDWRNRVDS